MVLITKKPEARKIGDSSHGGTVTNQRPSSISSRRNTTSVKNKYAKPVLNSKLLSKTNIPKCERVNIKVLHENKKIQQQQQADGRHKSPIENCKHARGVRIKDLDKKPQSSSFKDRKQCTTKLEPKEASSAIQNSKLCAEMTNEKEMSAKPIIIDPKIIKAALKAQQRPLETGKLTAVYDNSVSTLIITSPSRTSFTKKPYAGSTVQSINPLNYSYRITMEDTKGLPGNVILVSTSEDPEPVGGKVRYIPAAVLLMDLREFTSPTPSLQDICLGKRVSSADRALKTSNSEPKCEKRTPFSEPNIKEADETSTSEPYDSETTVTERDDDSVFYKRENDRGKNATGKDNNSDFFKKERDEAKTFTETDNDSELGGKIKDQVKIVTEKDNNSELAKKEKDQEKTKNIKTKVSERSEIKKLKNLARSISSSKTATFHVMSKTDESKKDKIGSKQYDTSSVYSKLKIIKNTSISILPKSDATIRAKARNNTFTLQDSGQNLKRRKVELSISATKAYNISGENRINGKVTLPKREEKVTKYKKQNTTPSSVKAHAVTEEQTKTSPNSTKANVNEEKCVAIDCEDPVCPTCKQRAVTEGHRTNTKDVDQNIKTARSIDSHGLVNVFHIADGILKLPWYKSMMDYHKLQNIGNTQASLMQAMLPRDDLLLREALSDTLVVCCSSRKTQFLDLIQPSKKQRRPPSNSILCPDSLCGSLISSDDLVSHFNKQHEQVPFVLIHVTRKLSVSVQPAEIPVYSPRIVAFFHVIEKVSTGPFVLMVATIPDNGCSASLLAWLYELDCTSCCSIRMVRRAREGGPISSSVSYAGLTVSLRTTRCLHEVLRSGRFSLANPALLKTLKAPGSGSVEIMAVVHGKSTTT